MSDVDDIVASATIDKWGVGDLVTTYEDPNVVDIDQRSSTFSLPIIMKYKILVILLSLSSFLRLVSSSCFFVFFLHLLHSFLLPFSFFTFLLQIDTEVQFLPGALL